MIQDIFNSKAFNKKYNYDGEDLGVTYSTQVSLFKVWSPYAEQISLMLYKSGEGNNLLREIPMQYSEKGIWKAEIERDLKGIYYTYKVEQKDGIYEVVDPYAKAVGINGKRGMIIDLKETNPKGWEQHKRPQLGRMTDAIIYELHIRDLSTDPHANIKNKGKYLAFTETGTTTVNGDKTGIDHIKELGATHVQLLPCTDFSSIDESKRESQFFNWGYDPENFNVPEGSYATDAYDGRVRIKEFKQAVMALHENGLGVIMDVVYNHTHENNKSKLNLLVPGYYYRKTEEGEFSNGSGCGNEIASERFMVRKMIMDSVVYWIQEYKIDGFRFDLMGVLDIKTMNAIRKAAAEINPSIILYGEGWSGGMCSLPESKRAVKINAMQLHHVGVFNDDLRDAIKGNVFNPFGKGFISGESNMEESVKMGVAGAIRHKQIDYSKVIYSKAPYARGPEQCINYVSVHDNLTLWDKIEASSKEETLEEKIKMQKLSNAIILTSQGIPFLHAGVEFCRTKYGDENSYKSPDSINQLNWLRKAEFREVFNYYKGLIALRKAHPAFRLYTAKQIQKSLSFMEGLGPNIVGYKLNYNGRKESWHYIIVLFNGNKESRQIEIEEGNWQVVVNDKQAGIEVVEKVAGGKITIAGRSALILIKDSRYEYLK